MASIRRYKITHTRPVYPLPIMGDVDFQEKVQKQQQQATTLSVHIWYTGSGHGAAAQKPEDTR